MLGFARHTCVSIKKRSITLVCTLDAVTAARTRLVCLVPSPHGRGHPWQARICGGGIFARSCCMMFGTIASFGALAPLIFLYPGILCMQHHACGCNMQDQCRRRLHSRVYDPCCPPQAVHHPDPCCSKRNSTRTVPLQVHVRCSTQSWRALDWRVSLQYATRLVGDKPASWESELACY